MKRKNKLLYVLFTLIMFVLTCASSVSAKETYKYSIKTLKNNTWSTKHVDSTFKYDANENITVTCYLYKIVIPADGYLYFDNKSSSRGGKVMYQNYKDFAENENYEDLFYGEWKQYIPVSKGTYYVTQENSVFKYVYKQAVNKANYSANTAINLKSNTTANVCQTPMHNYNRWYKIKLTSKKLISVYIKKGIGYDIGIYNSKGKKLAMANSGNKFYTYSKQPAGTYYIKVNAAFDDGNGYPYSFTSFLWK